MSDKLPSREQAIALLRSNNCPNEVIEHCIAVADLAKETAQTLQQKGYTVNVDVVEIGALLHDLGRAKTHTVNHAIVGAEIAMAQNLPECVIDIIKRHVGGGITAVEASKLGWPRDGYVPLSLEEKIVSYADKLVEPYGRVSVELTLERLRKENLNAAADRVKKVHDEITHLLEENS
ncbi:MAG: HDIG domain-containing protein [Candidatus Bathyarchaeota archaeon]|nr:HDIG domain-containing protein [Candidatus Bathyarchaeota archaeon]